MAYVNRHTRKRGRKPPKSLMSPLRITNANLTSATDHKRTPQSFQRHRCRLRAKQTMPRSCEFFCTFLFISGTRSLNEDTLQHIPNCGWGFFRASMREVLCAMQIWNPGLDLTFPRNIQVRHQNGSRWAQVPIQRGLDSHSASSKFLSASGTRTSTRSDERMGDDCR
jgi:hypothetical protein